MFILGLVSLIISLSLTGKKIGTLVGYNLDENRRNGSLCGVLVLGAVGQQALFMQRSPDARRGLIDRTLYMEEAAFAQHAQDRASPLGNAKKLFERFDRASSCDPYKPRCRPCPNRTTGLILQLTPILRGYLLRLLAVSSYYT